MLIGDQSLCKLDSHHGGTSVYAGSSENVTTEKASVVAPLSVQELLGICGRQVSSL